MRIKFLSIIACFLFVCIAVSSCLDSEETITASSDATVHSFGIDTIHGKDYPFAIDQINRRIYNLNPLPVGSDTLLDSILIDTFMVAGYVTSGLTNDTLLNTSNHQDLRGAINVWKLNEKYVPQNGLKFKIHAADAVTVREYTLSISVFQHDPDSIRWNALEGVTATANDQRTIVLGNELLLYLQNGNEVALYKNSTTNYGSWNLSSLQGISLNTIPHMVKISQTTSHATVEETLYTVAGQQLYQSTDGAVWTAASMCAVPQGYALEQLICSFEGTLVGLLSKDSKKYLMPTNEEITAWMTDKATELPQGFPTENIYATEYQTANLLNQVMLVGRLQPTDTKVIPWAYDGKNWTLLDPETQYNSYCLTEKTGFNPAVMHYAGKFYLFGEKLDFVYCSESRLAWYQADKKIFLPKEIASRGNFSCAIDQEQYIWLATRNQNKIEFWRGRLNQFGYNN